MIPDSTLGLACGIFVSALYAFASYFLNRPLFGHRLKIAFLSLSSARDARFDALLFNKTYKCSFAASLASQMIKMVWPVKDAGKGIVGMKMEVFLFV